MRLAHSDGYIQGSGVRIRARHPVVAAHLIGDRVVVVYDWMAFEPGTPARNLYCYGLNGEELWRAGDIGMGATDAYTAVLKEEPLWLGNFAGFDCQIDPTTGKVLDRSFTK